MTSPVVYFTLFKTTVVPPGFYSAKDLEALAVFALGRQRVKGPVELSLDLTGHKRIQELNRRFRGVDRTTDVISFRSDPSPLYGERMAEGQERGSAAAGHEMDPLTRGRRAARGLSPRRGRGDSFTGDLAINVHQAALQAKKMKHPVKREIRLLLIHGILHLLGYTDYESGPRRRMFKRQNALLLSWERI
jgi:probable rRNA maturation factor